MKRPWQIASFLFLAISIFVLVDSFEYSYRDRLGPGPGFFPFWMSLITGILSLSLFLKTTLSKSNPTEGGKFLPPREGAFRIFMILTALVFVLFSLDFLGFRISMLAFLLFLPVILGVRNWLVIPLLAIVGSFGVFHVFYYLLKLPLPIGIFGI